jgi:hypothetical protein
MHNADSGTGSINIGLGAESNIGDVVAHFACSRTANAYRL